MNASGGMEFLSRSGIDTVFFLKTGELLAQTLWRKSNLATISSFQVKVLLEICYKRIISKQFIFLKTYFCYLDAENCFNKGYSWDNTYVIDLIRGDMNQFACLSKCLGKSLQFI